MIHVHRLEVLGVQVGDKIFGIFLGIFGMDGSLTQEALAIGGSLELLGLWVVPLQLSNFRVAGRGIALALDKLGN